MDYTKDITIDSEALDIEWLNQSGLAMKYGKLWAKAFQAHQEAEENVKLVRADLIREANEAPEECLGIGIKATAGNIESYYREHPKHIRAKMELIQSQYELNIAELVKKEISVTRKAALQNLVDLFGKGYFAGPEVPRVLSLEVAKNKKQSVVDSGIKRKMKKVRRTDD